MSTQQTSPGREWVSFVDDAAETWLFDLSFFGSNWTCIYGDGCAGIEAEPDTNAHRGCCSYGAHFSDDEDLLRVMRFAAALPHSVWQHHDHRPEIDPASNDVSELVEALTELDDDGDRVTRTVDGACIFLNNPDFDRGPGCALHVAALDTGTEPHEWKPEVCWQLPVRVEHHVDEHDQVTHLVRQWTRADWGDAGRELGWWCDEAPEAYSGDQAVAQYLWAEVAALAGPKVADSLVRHVGITETGVQIRG